MGAKKDLERFVVQQKVSRIASKKVESEYFIDGTLVDMDQFPVSCIMKESAGDNCTVVVADGPYTGMELNLPRTSVKEVTKEGFGDIAKGLF